MTAVVSPFDDVADGAARARFVRARSHSLRWFVIGVGTLITAMVIGLVVGAADLSVTSVLATFVDALPGVRMSNALEGTDRSILFQLRLPRVVLAAMVGAALALAGASYQGVFRNPLADPYLLGSAAGAGLGATIVLASGVAVSTWPINPLPVAAFAGALLAVVMSSGMAAAVGGRAMDSSSPSAVLLLAGVAVASFLTSVQTFVQQQRSDTLRLVYAWILGGLTTTGWSDVALIAPYLLVASITLLAMARRLDVMAVGDEEARSLGVSPRRVRVVVILAASLATAAAVAVSGLIGFVGLVIPHAVRAVIGHAHTKVLVGSMLVGGAFLVLADTVSRTIIAPAELPLGVLTAFVGAPAFAYVLIRQHRRRA